MDPLEQVQLTRLMKLTAGRKETVIGLIDGPVTVSHAELASANIREITGGESSSCSRPSSVACMHGTFVAGILCAKRNSIAPAICPNCTVIVRPIFGETGNRQMPSASPEELAIAIVETVEAGARVINLSSAIAQPSSKGEHELEEALSYAARRGVIVVAAAGNQGAIGSTPITRHHSVIPVVACDVQGRLTSQSNLGGSIGRRGLSAPGDNITSLGTNGKPVTSGGTSVAAPFVTGTIALLWSEFPNATAAELRLALTQAHAARRRMIVPPLLNAWAAYQFMLTNHERR